jgi:hypothetical protein
MIEASSAAACTASGELVVCAAAGLVISRLVESPTPISQTTSFLTTLILDHWSHQ